MDNKLTTAVSVEQLRALAEKIREAKAGAVTEMKVAIQAMHDGLPLGIPHSVVVCLATGLKKSLGRHLADQGRHGFARGLDEVSVLNELQERGVISDNAISVDDVGNGGVAIAWLEKRDQRRFRERETARRAA